MRHTIENRKLARTSSGGRASFKVNDVVIGFGIHGPVGPIQGKSSETIMIGGLRFSPSFDSEQRFAERSANPLPEYPKRC
jgi:hypothetical protein